METREHIPLAQRLAWFELWVGRNSVFKVHTDARAQTGNASACSMYRRWTWGEMRSRAPRQNLEVH
jgi:hypothetical protein